MYVYVCMYVHMYVRMYVCMYVHMYVHMYVYMCVCTVGSHLSNLHLSKPQNNSIHRHFVAH